MHIVLICIAFPFVSVYIARAPFPSAKQALTSITFDEFIFIIPLRCVHLPVGWNTHTHITYPRCHFAICIAARFFSLPNALFTFFYTVAYTAHDASIHLESCSDILQYCCRLWGAVLWNDGFDFGTIAVVVAPHATAVFKTPLLLVRRQSHPL